MPADYYEVGTFGAVDYVVFAASLIISVLIGLYFACTGSKQNTNDEFLLGDRNMSPFPISLSLVASYVSAITVLGTPAEMYMYGSMFWIAGFSFIGAGLITSLFIPIFLRIGITSNNEYLEMRFNKTVRLTGTLLFFAQMILYLGIVIWAPALALNQVTGLNLYGSVITIGLVCTFYTTIGGMKAVVWSNAFQLAVMMAGFFAVIIKGSMEVGGLSNAWQMCEEGGRIDFWDFNPDPKIRHTFWSLVVGASFSWGSTYAVNQAQVQRYLACGRVKVAYAALFMAFVGMSVVVSVACLSGLVMYANFKDCDPYTAGYITSPDQLIPYFVMYLFGNMAGIPGLFTSAVFSAALSTVSSGLNSLSAVTAEDIIKPLFPNMTEKKFTFTTKMLAVFYGAVCIGVSFLASQLGGVLQAAISVFGMVGGPLLGLFSLGVFVPWTNPKGALGGTVLGLVWSLWVGIGGIIYHPHVDMPPLTTAGCYNETLTTVAATMYIPIEEPRSAIENLYSLSYSWYTTAAWMQTFFWGIVISFLTGPTDPRTVNPKLISPVADRMYCCLPEHIKERLRCGVGELYEEEDKKQDDVALEVKYDNPTFLSDDLEKKAKPLEVNGTGESKYKDVGIQCVEQVVDEETMGM